MSVIEVSVKIMRLQTSKSSKSVDVKCIRQEQLHVKDYTLQYCLGIGKRALLEDEEKQYNPNRKTHCLLIKSKDCTLEQLITFV